MRSESEGPLVREALIGSLEEICVGISFQARSTGWYLHVSGGDAL